MGEYMVRSVSSDIENARSDYQSWLFDVISKHGVKEANVVAGRATPFQELYFRMPFQLSGRADMQELLGLIYDIQAKDYLHRISKLDIKPARPSGGFELDMTLEVAALKAAPEDAKPPTTKSWRVTDDQVAYSEAIMNRNLFEPPNQAPRYSGQKTLEATKGREEAFPLAFKDPDEHKLTYELAEPLENVSLDSRSGTLRVESDELTEINVKVRVYDDGFPKRVAEETLLVKIVDPPPPPNEEPEEEMKFDDAKQTYLTGLVQGSDDWTAWMNVRTRGTTLKLRVGDEFEIGSVRGMVESIDADRVTIKIDDKLISLTSGGTLKSAVDSAE